MPTLRVIALACLFFASGGSMAAEHTYTLHGRITDTDDNWLPDVRVGLVRANVVARTDGNGLFTLSFTRSEPLVPDAKQIYEVLDLDKDGYQGRSIDITDPAYFDRPVTVTLEPNPVGDDNVGFSVRMPTAHSLHGVNRALGSPEPGTPIPAEDFQRVFARMETIRTNGPTDRVWFHAYAPRDNRPLKAAFLISRHGMGTIDHPRLRDFADRHSIALIGILGSSVQRGCYPVTLLDAPLRKLADMLGRPELSTVPFFTFGHSNGTGFAAIFPACLPERVIGWISYHSGWSWHLQFPGVEHVPGLVMHGQRDQWFENGQEQIVRHLRRRRNAALAMMVEGNVRHGPVDTDATWAFIVEFCEAALRIRLNADGSLRPVTLDQGWLGANYDRSLGGQQDLAVAPYAEYPGDRFTANWLPDAQFAETWRVYGLTDPRQGR